MQAPAVIGIHEGNNAMGVILTRGELLDTVLKIYFVK